MKIRLIILWTIGIFLTTSAWADNPRETPVVNIVRQNANAVVSISTEKMVMLPGNPFAGLYGNDADAFFRQFYGVPAQTLKLKNVGSGFIVDKNGLIVTNAHVVDMTTNIVVVLNDGTQVEGEVQYENPVDDLAIIKITPSVKLKELRLGKTDDLMMGETAIAIGNPLGLENSVSVGVVSAKGRTIFGADGRPAMKDLIQTDTPINPGNSGGPLLNLNGEVIGINMAVVQNSQGIGFAIPVEKVKKLLADYRKDPTAGTRQNAQASFPSLSGQSTATFPQDNDAGTSQDQLNAINQMLHNAFTPPSVGQNTSSFNNNLGMSGLNLNREETKNAYVITLDVKGLNKNNINVNINQGSITISGEMSNPDHDPTGGFHSSSFSSFYQTLPVPPDANIEKATTKFKGDTLTITLPKK
ncbi:MAG: trypsin-like peptidase domain-containing protein [Candidatus Omnitrophica bacterium]|nr:trypsin-like peptidase domain-containing protein [Candidatus Omnitrophota bacterium]